MKSFLAAILLAGTLHPVLASELLPPQVAVLTRKSVYPQVTCTGRGLVPLQVGQATVNWAGPQASASGSNQDIYEPLLDLLKTDSVAVRAEVVRALRGYIGAWQVEREIRSILNNAKEPSVVRREALISLWDLFSQLDVRREILGCAVNKEAPVELRITAYHLLSRAVCNDDEVRSMLHSALEEDNEAIRQAAAWALWTDINNKSTLQHLIGIAKDGRNSPPMRVEALRSLVESTDDWEVQRLMLEVAQQTQADAAIREAATLGLSYLKPDSTVRQALTKLAIDTQFVVSRAAIRTLGGPDLHTWRYFEHIVE